MNDRNWTVMADYLVHCCVTSAMTLEYDRYSVVFFSVRPTLFSSSDMRDQKIPSGLQSVVCQRPKRHSESGFLPMVLHFWYLRAKRLSWREFDAPIGHYVWHGCSHGTIFGTLFAHIGILSGLFTKLVRNEFHWNCNFNVLIFYNVNQKYDLRRCVYTSSKYMSTRNLA